MTTEERIEAVAQDLYAECYERNTGTPWAGAQEKHRALMLKLARIAYARVLQSLLEPSKGMVEAAEGVPMNRYYFMGGEEADIYRAMIQLAIKEMGDA